VSGPWGTGEATIWAEQLTSLSPGAEVLLKYGKSNGWLDDQPAVISRVYGKGRITYIGAVLDEKLMGAAADWLTQKSDVKAVFGPVPDGIEVSRRVGAGKQVFVLVNYAQENRQVTLPGPMKLAFASREATSVDLAPYGVAVAVETK